MVGRVGEDALRRRCQVVFLRSEAPLGYRVWACIHQPTELIGEWCHVRRFGLEVEVESIDDRVAERTMRLGARVDRPKGVPDYLGGGFGSIGRGKSPFAVCCSADGEEDGFSFRLAVFDVMSVELADPGDPRVHTQFEDS